MKKYLVLFLLMLIFASCGQEKQTPVSVIFDTDLGPDYDDVGALTLLHALADNGEARILATVSSNRYEFVLPCVEVINRYYGRPDLPLGGPKRGGTMQPDGHAESWAQALSASFPHKIYATSDAPDAVQVYRRILAAEPDNSVVIITVGFFTNLANLLDSQPDEYSPLDGKQLITKKVKRLVSMAGAFPHGYEYNVFCDIDASQKVFSEWNTEIILSGFEIGEKILTGKRLIASDIPETPAKKVFEICLRQGDPDGRMSWDQTATLVGVRGTGEYFNTVRGTMTVAPDSTNSWQDDPNGKHQYLTFRMSPEELTVVIEDLMMHTPKNLATQAQPSAWNVRDHIPANKIIVQSHRGAGDLAPESTMESFELGWQLGTAPEGDVRTTSDGVIVSFHDGDLRRMLPDASDEMKKKGIKDLTFAEAMKLDVGAWKGEQFRGQRILSLAAIVEALKSHPERIVHLDIKDVDFAQLARETESVREQTYIATSNYEHVKEWKKLAPSAHAVLWMNGDEAKVSKKLDALEAEQFKGIDILEIEVKVEADGKLSLSDDYLRKTGDRLRKYGLLFSAFIPDCKDINVYKHLMDLGVSSFSTDYPDANMQAIAEYYSEAGKG